jgi:prepilin-type processing-associated H-X9-DG protein
VNDVPVQYGINMTLCDWYAGWPPNDADASRIFLFADAPGPWSSEEKGDRLTIAYPGFTYCDYHNMLEHGGRGPADADLRHAGGSNVAYLDGHVKLHPPGYIIDHLRVLLGPGHE